MTLTSAKLPYFDCHRKKLKAWKPPQLPSLIRELGAAIIPAATYATSQSWARSFVKKYTVGTVPVLEGWMGMEEIFQEFCYSKFIENHLYL